jgi:hypothetical protein
MNDPRKRLGSPEAHSVQSSASSQEQRPNNSTKCLVIPSTPQSTSTQREPSRNFFIRSLASSALGPVQHGYESPISIPSDAAWRCNSCRNTYAIQYARIDRPLGYFRCTTCHCSTEFDILNIPQLKKIPGIEYELAVPCQLDEPEPSPKSIFLWICCACGRSWPQPPVPRRVAPPSLQPQLSAARRILGSILCRQHENRAREPNQSPAPVDSRGCAIYIMTFDSGCLCTHYTCATCFRAMALVEGEKVARRLQEGEVVEIPQEILERRRQSIREMGLDPEEYFPS